MDTLAPEKRSWNMSRIRGANTKPELAVRSMLHRMGYRFRIANKTLPGRPDIVLPKYRAVIFVHGCFWHRHPGCSKATTPKTRADFWSAKFDRNIERDAEVERRLAEL
ncbi:MAG: very short patch repair endonuclease, partial [Nitrosomonas sp.]|nr:very short patch repair endonuclease [Nitrosomonas sp.]